MNKLSPEKAIDVLYTVRAYYASLTAGYPKGKDCKGIDDVTCSEIANSCLMAIKALEKESRWIPVSERMPEDSGEYLVWIKPYSEKSYVSIEDIDCDGMFKKWNTIYANSNEIVAWQPLPEPYKAESEV